MERLTLLGMSLFGALLSACAPSPTPCTTPGVCGSGEECLANRCVPLGSEPVAPGSRRLLFRPHAIAVVSARGPAQTDPLPNAVTFGGEKEGASALFLEFELRAHAIKSVDSAFLVLEPLPMSAPEPEQVEVDAWRIAEPWDRGSVTWLAQPSLAPPRARGVAQSSPLGVLRIDVSAIIRFWLRQPRQNRGLALKAPGGDGHGLSFATGASDGNAPRLELYVR
jgi:hypothetical protein